MNTTTITNSFPPSELEGIITNVSQPFEVNPAPHRKIYSVILCQLTDKDNNEHILYYRVPVEAKLSEDFGKMLFSKGRRVIVKLYGSDYTTPWRRKSKLIVDIKWL